MIVPQQVQGSGKPSASSGQHRVANILDNMTSNRKFSPLSGSAAKPSNGPVLKPLIPRPKSKVPLKLHDVVCRISLILNMSVCPQTQSTLLQMTGTKAASKKEKTEPTTEHRPRAPPPTSNADDAENKR